MHPAWSAALLSIVFLISPAVQAWTDDAGVPDDADGGPFDEGAGFPDADAGVVSTPESALAPESAPPTLDDETTNPVVAEPGSAPPSSNEAIQSSDAVEPELTDAEMAELMQAIGADAAEVDDKKDQAGPDSTTAPAPASGTASVFPTSGAGRMLQSMNPQMSFILDLAAAGFSPGWSFRGPQGSAGMANYQSGAHDPSQNGFNLQQLELHVESAVDPFFTFQSNIVFSKFGVEVEEAYATTMSLPWGFQARVGQFLTRFGRKNPTHPHSWHFADQPIVNGKFFGAEGSRGLGVEVSWLAPLPWYLEVYGSVNEAVDACCARSFIGAQSGQFPVIGPLDMVYLVGLKQFFPFGDDFSLYWGLTGASGPNPSGKNNRTELVGTDLYFRWRPTDSPGRQSISWTAEAIGRRYQIPGSVLMDAGFYSQLVWQFFLQYEVGARVEGVSGNLGDPLDPDWTGLRTRYTAQATYYPSHFSRLRLQASYGASGTYDIPIWEQLYAKPVFAVFAAIEFVVGAHGSHGF